MAYLLGLDEQQVIREFGRPPLRPAPSPVVYLLAHDLPPADGEPVKIGTASNLAKRIENLQAGAIRKLYLIAYVEGGRDLEREIHNEVLPWRIREDWFEMCDAIRESFSRRIEEQTEVAA